MPYMHLFMTFGSTQRQQRNHKKNLLRNEVCLGFGRFHIIRILHGRLFMIDRLILVSNLYAADARIR